MTYQDNAQPTALAEAHDQQKTKADKEETVCNKNLNTENMDAFQVDNKTGRHNYSAIPNDPLKDFAVSSLIGNDVFNPSGDALGKIKDIMIDITEGRVQYVVIEFGGFLGMNHKYFAIPFQALAMAKEHRHAFILNETKESLKQYPEFNKDQWANTNSEAHPGKSNEGGFKSGGTGE